jgi:hypothetical protein
LKAIDASISQLKAPPPEAWKRMLAERRRPFRCQEKGRK